MADNLKIINDNYKSDDDIAKELDLNLENVLEFNKLGEYKFIHCGICGGPRLGHIEAKCRQLPEGYNDILIKRMEDKLKGMEVFRKALKKHKEMEEEYDNKRRVKEIEATVGALLEKYERKSAETTQIVKSRFPPNWTGQKFERYREEVEKWTQNNKAPEDDKYIDLMESLKKNDKIKDYVQTTLIEKVADTRTVKKILDVLGEKYSITKAERLLFLMKEISEFSTDESIEKLMDKFEVIVTETDKVNLEANLKYALSLQFMDRLEKSKKINSSEKL